MKKPKTDLTPESTPAYRRAYRKAQEARLQAAQREHERHDSATVDRINGRDYREWAT